MTMKKKATELKIFFDRPKIFEMKNIKPLSGLTGLYFIFTDKIIDEAIRTFYCNDCEMFISVKYFDNVENKIRCKCGNLAYDWKE